MIRIPRAGRALAALATTTFLLAATSPAQALDLADSPLFSSVSVPGNLLLALSVEFPTASTAAYPSTPSYSNTTSYVGYFDPAKCYTYNYNTTTASSSYFVPYGSTTSSTNFNCSSSSSTLLWSGNWLNWASMQSLDEFRWVLTGGNRTTDTSSLTILTKTYHSGQASSGNTAQNKNLGSSALIAGATPFNSSKCSSTTNCAWTSLTTRTAGTGTMMLFSVSTTGAMSLTSVAIPAAGTYTVYTPSLTLSSSTVYALYMNVQVCASAALAESNCVLYGSSYKPEGLMQSYSSQLRYAAMGYLNDPLNPSSTGQKLDGGVLRARMNFIGPTQPVPGSTPTANAAPEWSSSTGIMATNPDPTDASNTATATGATGVTISQSGVMNYLNKFGYGSQQYKTYDPVSELYYAAIRYFKNLPPITTYYTPLPTGDASAATLLDGFPVIVTSGTTTTASTTTSDDPILYSCQKNFILGIGDADTNYDADLPGDKLNAAGLSNYIEPSQPSAVTSDATPSASDSVANSVITETNMIYKLETGTATGLAGTNGPTSGAGHDTGGNGTYFIGGLAYDAHTMGINGNRTTFLDGVNAQQYNGASTANQTVATISTYWLDVLEGQNYAANNQYYYAAKYGGFAYPSGVYPYGTKSTSQTITTVQPYSSSNVKDTLATVATATNGTTTNGTISLAIDSTSKSNAQWHTNTNTCWQTSLCGNGISNSGFNYQPDHYFTANNAGAMQSGLTAAFAEIANEAGSASTTTISTSTPNTTTIGTGSSVVSYGANYDAASWSGQVTASTVTFNADGSVASSPVNWYARDLLTSRLVVSPASAATAAAAARFVVTCCTTGSPPQGLQFNTGLFTASNLNTRTNFASFGAVPGVSSQSQANFLAYLRGDPTQELAPNGTGVYRDRTYKLGDIVDSKPVAVSVPSGTYSDANDPGYSGFKTQYTTTTPRNTVVYVGANDGMLHAFDGSTGASTSGKELFAYIPSFVYGDGTSTTLATTGLALLGDPSFTHHFLVDATPGQFDVDLNNTITSAAQSTGTYAAVSTTPAWSTLLIGGLGKGGNGYYALDITDPSTWKTEANVASKVLWEFTDSTMGYTYGTPSMVKTAKYGWVVVMTSGYSNSDGKGYFYFVNPLTGKLLEKVATTSGSLASPIDMGQHTAYVIDYTDGTADSIYGVDLQGDVWRLDVTGKAPNVNYPSPVLIATLKDANGVAQPITTRPLIQPDTTSAARYVLVGTGKLLGTTDIASTTSNPQSFYAFVDGTSGTGGFYTTSTLPSGVTFPIVRSELNGVTDLTAGITGSTAGKIGWYYDMPVVSKTDSSGVVTYIAQRVSTDPIATQGVVAWAGNLPNGSACVPTGTGTTYATAFSTGKTVLIDSTGNPLASSADLNGIVTDLSLLNENGTIRLNTGDSAGNRTPNQTQVITTSGPKQLNWRDVPLAN